MVIQHNYHFLPILEGVVYRCLNSDQDINQTLQDYFMLNKSLSELHKKWTSNKGGSEGLRLRLQELIEFLPNLRQLRQPPRDCLFSYICSQNSNIPRITKSVQCLSEEFGEFLGEIDEQQFFSFPSFNKLSKVSAPKLRDLGFGYRAEYIPATASKILELADLNKKSNKLATGNGKKLFNPEFQYITLIFFPQLFITYLLWIILYFFIYFILKSM